MHDSDAERGPARISTKGAFTSGALGVVVRRAGALTTAADRVLTVASGTSAVWNRALAVWGSAPMLRVSQHELRTVGTSSAIGLERTAGAQQQACMGRSMAKHQRYERPESSAASVTTMANAAAKPRRNGR